MQAIVVGTAFGGRVHVPALRAAGFDVVAVVGRDASRTAARADELGVPHGMTDLSAAIDLVDAPFAVTVATPPDAHRRAGAHRPGCRGERAVREAVRTHHRRRRADGSGCAGFADGGPCRLRIPLGARRGVGGAADPRRRHRHPEAGDVRSAFGSRRQRVAAGIQRRLVARCRSRRRHPQRCRHSRHRPLSVVVR